MENNNNNNDKFAPTTYDRSKLLKGMFCGLVIEGVAIMVLIGVAMLLTLL